MTDSNQEQNVAIEPKETEANEKLSLSAAIAAADEEIKAKRRDERQAKEEKAASQPVESPKNDDASKPTAKEAEAPKEKQADKEPEAQQAGEALVPPEHWGAEEKEAFAKLKDADS
jgi:hypothetical protein